MRLEYIAAAAIPAVLLGLLIQPFGYKRVPVTEIGLLVNQYGDEDSSAIDNAQVVKGAVWFNRYTQEVISVPRRQQEYAFTNNSDEYSELPQAVTFSVGGSPVTEEIGTEVAWNPDQLPQYYTKFGEDPIDFIGSNFFVGLRGCYNAEGQGITPAQYQTNRTAIATNVLDCLNKRFPEINVVSLDLLDQPVYASDIQESIDAQFKAQQRAQEAESNKAQAEAQGQADVAQAEAEAQVKLIEAENRAAVQEAEAETVTPQLLELRRLENEAARIQVDQTRAENWNGQEVGTVIQTPNVQVGASNN